MLASYSCLDFDKVYIYIELDAEFKSMKNEIHSIITSLFNQACIVWHRIQELSEWLDVLGRVSDSSSSGVILFSCNDDHIYVGPDKTYLDILLKFFYILSDHNYAPILSISHWQESLSLSSRELILKPFNFCKNRRFASNIGLSYYASLTSFSTSIAIQIYRISDLIDLFRFGICKSSDYRRSDSISLFKGALSSKRWITMIPHLELFRHFDAYSHSPLLDHNKVAPLSIPYRWSPYTNNMVYYSNDCRSKDDPLRYTISTALAEYPKDSNCLERSMHPNTCDMRVSASSLPAFFTLLDLSQPIELPQVYTLNFSYAITNLTSSPVFGFSPLVGYLLYRKTILFKDSRFNVKSFCYLSIVWPYRFVTASLIYSIKYCMPRILNFLPILKLNEKFRRFF